MYLNNRKLCGGCGKIVSSFPWLLCESCKNDSTQTKTKSSRIAYIKEQKSKPCTDCGISYPWYVMDFDHLPQYQKDFGIREAITAGKTLDEVKSEIAKCELVCANCHRIRTYNRSKNLV